MNIIFYILLKVFIKKPPDFPEVLYIDIDYTTNFPVATSIITTIEITHITP